MRRLTSVFVAIILMSIGSWPAFGQIARRNEVVGMQDALKEMLQNHGATSLKKVTVTINADKAKQLANVYGIESAGVYTVYRGIGEDKATVTGTVVVVNEEGKEGPLQVLVAIDPTGKIYDIGFTVFGESQEGKSAFKWSFLKQFIDKKAGDAFVVGDDVDGISGATWTSNSITHAVERAVMVYAEFLD